MVLFGAQDVVLPVAHHDGGGRAGAGTPGQGVGDHVALPAAAAVHGGAGGQEEILGKVKMVEDPPGKALRLGRGENRLFPGGAQAGEQLRRTPRPLPVMKLNPAVDSIFGFRYEDFTLEGYDPYPSIKAPIAV